MGFDIGGILSKVGSVVSKVDNVVDTVANVANTGIKIAKTPLKNLELPFVGNLLGKAHSFLSTAGKFVAPFRDVLPKIPFVGGFVDKAAGFLFDKAPAFLSKSAVGNFSFLAKIVPTVEKLANIVTAVGKFLDPVVDFFPQAQGNVANIAAKRQAELITQ